MSELFNVGLVHERIAAAEPDLEFFIFRDRRITHEQFAERTRRFASYLHGRGLGCHTERRELEGHESGQDHLAIYLHNGNEYVEAMLGAFKARVAPFNVNYRYVEDELRYLFHDAKARAIVYHSAFAPAVAAIVPDLPDVEVLIQVADESGNALLPGAVDYEEALATSSPEMPPVELSPDDLYILYTGGTTGKPKGVLWRQHDAYLACFGGKVFGTWTAVQNYDEVEQRAHDGRPIDLKLMPLAPLMHGNAQWACLQIMSNGGAIVFPSDVIRFDPASVLDLAEREKVRSMAVVGDAMVRPLLDELDRRPRDLSALITLGNGGAQLTAEAKERMLAHVPHAMILDGVGASETGAQMIHLSTGGDASTGRFTPGPDTVVLDEDLVTVRGEGSEGEGWLARMGEVPLGYLGDPDKTRATFPVIDGIRFSVPGDRAVLQPGGDIDLLGRQSTSINSGGEKIFAEEVEGAIVTHPAVHDVLVVGRPSERWGQEVVAVYSLTPGTTVTDDELAGHAGTTVARYKVPKAWIVVDEVRRSAAGKADYAWARAQATRTT
jgi:fatty-acyl-CoA synthase